MTLPDINIEKAADFLVNLLNIPSPTGYGREAIAYCEEAFTALNIPNMTTRRTHKGGLMIDIEGASHEGAVGLTAHTDTLGLMVSEIKPNGRLRCTALGGVMWSGIEFEGVTVRTFDNQRIRGTVVPINPSVHVNRKIHSSDRNPDTMEIRLDILTNSAAETREAGIEVGDFVFLDPRVEIGEAGFIRSRFLDDKLSVACVYAALDAMVQAGETPKMDVQFLISNYEEVGHGGAADWRDDMFELIAIDMAAIGYGQNSDEFNCTICVKDSGGPYHIDTIQRLRQAALFHDIPIKTDVYPYYSSDASAYWRAGGAARIGLIGPGVDASHSYERSHKLALTRTAQLIAAYLLD